jgi:hypothetical protein
VFVLGLDHQVYAEKFDGNANGTSGFFLVAVGTVRSFTLGYDGSGHPELFAVGTDNQVYAVRFDVTGQPASGYFLTRKALQR